MGDRKASSEFVQTMKNEFLDTDQVMELLGVSRQTIHNWTCGKKIPYYKFGKTLKFHVSDIQCFIASRKINSLKAS